MNITASVGITAVLALTISCGRAQVRPADAQPQASPAAAATAASVPALAAVLAQYVGEYNINGATMKFRLRGDRLVREMSGQPDQVLTPVGKSDTRFRVGTSQMELEFQADNSGRVVLIMRAGQHEARGVRMR